MGLFSRLFKKPEIQDSLPGSSYGFRFGPSTSGKVVNQTTAMQTSAVYACVRVLSEALAGLPLHVYRYTEDGGKERATDFYLDTLLHDSPNEEQTSFIFRETMMCNILTSGNGYAQIIRNGMGQVVALYPLMPKRMLVDRGADGKLYYQYQLGSDEAQSQKEKPGSIILQAKDILHIPAMSFDGIMGESPIAVAKNSVGLSIACSEYTASFYKNGAAPSGVLEHPGLIKDVNRVREGWNNNYGGSGNAGKVAVLEEGMKFTPISVSPADSDLIDTMKYTVTDIARIFRVPPHMIADLDRATFSNVEQMSLEFVQYTLNPWVIRWEQALTKALLTPEERKQYFIQFNVDGLLRGDYESRMNGYAAGIQCGLYSINDCRKMQDMRLVPEEKGGNTHMVNGNMIDAGHVGVQYTKNQ